MIFFGENGLTNTSANYIANIAKEKYQDIEGKLRNFHLYSTTCGLIGSKERSALQEGVGQEFLDNMEENLVNVARLKSLIAWLREAIKARESLIAEIKMTSEQEICAVLGMDCPNSPEKLRRLTSDDVVTTWNIKQRNRYYYLETLCATLGAYVHKNGSFNEARQDLITALSCKHFTNGEGRDTVIYERIPSVSIENVDKTFFELQAKYREYQAELNSMKHEIEMKLQADDNEKSSIETDNLNNYHMKMREIHDATSNWKRQQLENIQKMRIVIPDSLKGIYEYVSQAGKE